MAGTMSNTGKRGLEELEQMLQVADPVLTPPQAPTALENWRADLLTKARASTGMASVIKLIEDDTISHHALLISVFKMDLRDIGIDFLQVPTGIVVQRGAKDKIIRLSSGSKHLDGVVLEKVLAVFSHYYGGHRVITFDGTVRDKPFLGFYVPGFNLITWKSTRKDANRVDTEFTGGKLIMGTHSVNSALTKKSVLDVLNLGVPAGQVTYVMRALNDVLLVTEDFDPSGVTNLKDIIVRANDETVPKKARAFYTTLQGALLAKATMDEKVQAFVSNPSLKLGIALAFQKPLVRNLYAGDKNAVVQKRNLSTLKPSELVMLSSVGWDGKYYEEEASLTAPVYTQGDYKVKTGKNNFRAYEGGTTISAEHLRTIISAISASRGVVNAGPSTEPTKNPDVEGDRLADF